MVPGWATVIVAGANSEKKGEMASSPNARLRRALVLPPGNSQALRVHLLSSYSTAQRCLLGAGGRPMGFKALKGHWMCFLYEIFFS